MTTMAEWSEWVTQVNTILAETERRLTAAEARAAELAARLATLETTGHACSYPDAGPPHTHEIGHEPREG